MRGALADARVRLIVGTGVLALSPALVGVMAARTLGPDGRGELAVALAIGTLAGTIAMRGLDVALLAGTATHVPVAQVRAVLRRRVGVALCVEGVVAGLAVAGVLGLSAIVVVAVVPALTAAAASFGLVRAANLAAGRSGAVLAGDLTSAAIALAIAAGFTVAGPHPAAFVGAACIGLVAGAAVGLRPVRAAGAGPVGDVGAWHPGTVARAAWLGRVFQGIAFRLDRIVLAVFAGSTATGLYAAAVPLAEMVTIVPLHLAQLVTVRVASSPDARPWHRYRDVRLLLVACVAGSVVLVAAAPWLIDVVYGPEFDGAVHALRVLAVASALSVVWRFAEADLYGRSIARPAAVATAVAAVVVLATTAMLSGIGAEAAAYGSLAGYAAGTIIVVGAGRRRRDA